MMEPHWWWLAAAIVLAIAELVVPGAFLIWVAAGAALTAVAALLLGVPLAFQFVLFGLFSVASVYLGRRFYGNAVESSDPLLNDRAARLVGRSVSVVTSVNAHGGRVRVGDGEWNARGGPAEPGEHVLVTSVEGNFLHVSRLPELPPSKE